MPLTRITVLETGTSSYDGIRIKRPLAWPGMRDALWREGIHVEHKQMKDASLQGFSATDCLVLHGVGTPGIMNLLRKLPCRIASFQDDLMTDPPPWNPHKINDAQRRVLDWCLQNACAIVATTQPLAKALGYPDKTVIQANLEDFAEKPVGSDDRMRRAIYCGGNSHAGDIELLNGLDWDGDTVIWSSCLPSSRTAMYRNRLGDLELKPDRANWGHIQPTADYETYCTWLKNLLPRFGVGLAPLVDHPFNCAKSDWKYIEYAKFGLVPVLSDVGPYKAVPEECCVKVGGDSHSADWSCWVKYAVAHPEIADRAWEWCRATRSYQAHWRSWIETFKFIASQI